MNRQNRRSFKPPKDIHPIIQIVLDTEHPYSAFDVIFHYFRRNGFVLFYCHPLTVNSLALCTSSLKLAQRTKYYALRVRIMTKRLTPTKAALEWGLHRSVLYEKMKRGELSYTTDVGINGKERRFIDPSEMIRCFGEPETKTSKSEKTDVINTNSGELEVYKRFVESLQKQLAEKDSLIRKQSDLLASRDTQVQSLIDQLAEVSQRLLPAPVDDDFDEDEPEKFSVSKRKFWWFSRKSESVY